ncbi:MAG: MFS transporter [Marmoricola sp.]|nr:MFS transporter [Marmoricola sp.]
MTDQLVTPPAVDPAEPAARTGRVLPFLSVAQFMVFLDVSIVNVAMPSIQHALSIGESDLPYVVTAYGTVLGGFLLLGSRLADVVGRRRVLRLGLAVFGLASLAAGLAQDPTTLFVARGVQGLGSALVAPSALSILTTTHTRGPERAKALGVWGALTGVASVAGVVLGGVLAEGPGWRWIFFVNVPIALVMVVTAPAVLPESRGERRPFDALGAVLPTTGLLAVVHALGEATTRGWTDVRSGGFLVVGCVLLLCFVAQQHRSSAPLVPLSVFRLASLRAANLAGVFLLAAVVTLFYFASLYLQQVLGYSALRTGLSYVPLASTVACSAGVTSVLVTRIPPRRVLAAGLLVMAIGLAMLAVVPGDAAYPTRLLPAFLVVALGMGACFVTVQVAANADVGPDRAGLAAGLIGTSQEVGGALGVAVAATVAFGRHLARASSSVAAQVDRFHHAFWVAAACTVLALVVVAVAMPRLAVETPVGED